MRNKRQLLLVLSILLWFVKAHEEQVIEADGTIHFGQTLGTKKTNISENCLYAKKTPQDKPFGVFDGILSSKDHVLLKMFLSCDNSDWKFNNYDGDEESQKRTYDNTAWINDQDPLSFSTTQLSQKLIEAVKHISKDDGPYYPYRVFGKILRRGDVTKVAKDSDDGNDFTAMVFMNTYWKKNYYGELYIYDDNKEIVGGATHKSGRVVVWQSDIYRLNRPPAVQFLQGQVLFQVQYTKDKSKMEKGHEEFVDFKKKRSEAHEKWNLPDYQFPDNGIEKLDISKHKKFEFTTKTDGRKIFVFDDLFPKDLLDHLRKFVLEYGTYFYDDSIDTDSDNVQWIAGFRLNPYIKSPYWKIIKKAAEYVTGTNEYFPYDISINLVRNADFTRIHKDVGYYGEEEFTCLVYLNQGWKRDYYGETTFFEKDSDDTEIVAQVKPKYGRLVVFDGNIPHSARPPSFNFTGARLTFVTKLHHNEYSGRRKNFQEELRFFRSIIGQNFELNMLNSEQGEEYAKETLQSQTDTLQNRTFTPENEEGDNKEDDGEREGEEDSPQEINDEIRLSEEKELEEEILKAKEKGVIYVKRVQTPLVDSVDDLDPITKKLLEPLDELSEETPNGVDLLKNVHGVMTKKVTKFTDRFKRKTLEIL